MSVLQEHQSGIAPVGDLHAITPDEYLEFGDAVVHKLSYQQARHFYVPIRGVYVANPGYVFGSAAVPRGTTLYTNCKPLRLVPVYGPASFPTTNPTLPSGSLSPPSGLHP